MRKHRVKEAFILRFSGAAEWKNEKEMWTEDGSGQKITIEFLDGIDSYVVRKYYGNGKLRYEYSHKNYQTHGICFGYYSSGKIKYESNYFDGKIHGKQISYYENGNIHSEIDYKNGKLFGITAIYFNDGRIKNRSVYKNGILMEVLIQ